ncbi:MAG: LamG domain-containing protein [Phycisphaeraceae bacterium]
MMSTTRARLWVLAAMSLLTMASQGHAVSYQSTVLADAPLAYWQLNEAAGPTATDSAGGNNGAADAGVLFGQTSVRYNTSDTATTVSGAPRIATGSFAKGPSNSAEYWVRLNAGPTGFHNILGDGESGGDFYMMNYLTNTGRIRPHYSTANAPVSTDSNHVLVVGDRYHVVTTYDNAAGTSSIYINGVLDKTIAVTTNAPTNTGNQMFIGRDNREAGGNMTLQDAALYSSALTAAQVRQHRIAGYAGADAVVLTSLTHYYNFDEASSGTANASNIFGVANTGAFVGTATRTPGAIGLGAAGFNNTGGDGVNVGSANFSFTTGIAIEALIKTNWSGNAGDYDEIFRKEDGGNRILLSFQNDAFDAVNGPVLGFGLNIGGYAELDMPLDGVAGRPTLAQLADGNYHHVVASYDSATGLKAIYIDGLLAFSQFLAPGTLITSGGGVNGFIGNTSALNEPFGGMIDEFAMYNSGLDAASVAAHYRSFQAGLNFFTVPVPEPATLSLLAFAGAAALRRRRRGHGAEAA